MPRILFTPGTEAAALPPVINAAVLMAESGWNVTVLTAPVAGSKLTFPAHPRIDIHALRERPSHVMSKFNYLRYTARAIRLARSIRPNVVYASDPLGAGPGLLAAKSIGARLAYHEHDSPTPGITTSVLRGLRMAAARNADVVIFPNEDRARLAHAQIGFALDRLHIIWNVPRKSEMPPITDGRDEPMIIYYHGTITPDRLPRTVIDAILRFNGAIRLHVAGYEVPSSDGHIDKIQQHGITGNGQRLVQYLGVFSHSQVLVTASRAHVGLALMPLYSADVNMQHMTGASNKIFDYMAAGLPALVSDLPDWRRLFVVTGFARACDPTNVDSVSAALSWFRDNLEERRNMGARSRAKILTDWNYDTAFAPVIDLFNAWVPG